MALDEKAILSRAREILGMEAAAVGRVRERVGDAFVRMVRAVLEGKGKVVVTGVGKSGLVAQKVAATLSSTGTPAVFLHPVEGLHGDLGVVQRGDVVLALSNSGESEEVLGLVSAAKERGARIASMVGREGSTLGSLSEIVLDASVDREACPLGLAPTASTTAAMALGDAIAMVLEEARGFTREEFAAIHPGGTLGQRLAHQVGDLMRRGEKMPVVTQERTLRDAVDEMTAKESIGVTLVTEKDGRLVGIVTDGDLRRLLHASAALDSDLDAPVSKFMSKNPKTIEADAPASEALQLMEAKGITSLAVVDGRSRALGLIHLHDILGRGKVRLGAGPGSPEARAPKK
ncbi:MAG: KpsF/GutQ family sugar-phosphate isomerase [Planctomycetales bacterium]|nr:KpsF/GutQ family sugar-phosphate isomerase [Planctomycetales bacterium]